MIQRYIMRARRMSPCVSVADISLSQKALKPSPSQRLLRSGNLCMGSCRFLHAQTQLFNAQQSTENISQKNPILIEDLVSLPNYAHKDRVLFVTTLTTPKEGQLDGEYRVLIEDANEDCIILSLQNYIPRDTDPEEALPTGSYIALANPCAHSSAPYEQVAVLWCPNPQDVHLFSTRLAWKAAEQKDPAHMELEDPVSLQAQGRHALDHQRYLESQRLFARALSSPRILSTNQVDCWIGLAESCVPQQKWEQIQEACNEALALDSQNTRAMYLLAEALLHLHQVSLASQIAKELATLKEGEEATDLLQDCERMHKEQQGPYNVSQVAELLSVRVNSPKVHADYYSSKIDMGVQINSSYRGCVARQDIPAMEVLTLSKAFAYHDHCADRVRNDIVQKLHQRPALGKYFYNLETGTPKCPPLLDATRIDLDRIDLIVANNAFSGQSSGLEFMWDQVKEANRLRRPLNDKEFDSLRTGLDYLDKTGGLWLKEALFNHSCTPNATWSTFGDVLSIRSVRPILEGQEVTISYNMFDRTFAKRSHLFKSWVHTDIGFECRCPVCCEMRNNDKLCEIEEESLSVLGIAENLDWNERATAIEKILPQEQRHEMLSYLDSFPLQVQHNAGRALNCLEAVCLVNAGKLEDALNSWQKVADIGYEVRGDAIVDRSVDLWFVAGSALECGHLEKSKQDLAEIWNGAEFKELASHSTEAEEAFIQLTLHQAPGGCRPDARNDNDYLKSLEQIAKDVCQEKNSEESNL